MSGNYHETWAYRLTKFLHNRATLRSFETFSQFLLDRDYRNSFLSCGLIFLQINAFFLEARNLRGIGRRTLHFFSGEKSSFGIIFKISRFPLWYCWCWVTLVKKLSRKFWRRDKIGYDSLYPFYKRIIIKFIVFFFCVCFLMMGWSLSIILRFFDTWLRYKSLQQVVGSLLS